MKKKLYFAIFKQAKMIFFLKKKNKFSFFQKEKKLAKLISSLLKAELSADATSLDENQMEEINNINKKFENLKNFNISITENIYVIKKKEPVAFILSNGSLFISEVNYHFLKKKKNLFFLGVC